MVEHEVRIRQARRQDAAGLCALSWAFHEAHVQVLPDRLRSYADDATYSDELYPVLARLFASQDSALFVAELGSDLVGLLQVTVHAAETHPARVGRHSGLIDALIVLAAWRRQGVGSALMAAAEAWAHDQGAAELRLELWARRSGPLPFYEHRGYRTLSRVLVKPLTPSSPPSGLPLASVLAPVQGS